MSISDFLKTESKLLKDNLKLEQENKELNKKIKDIQKASGYKIPQLETLAKLRELERENAELKDQIQAYKENNSHVTKDSYCDMHETIWYQKREIENLNTIIKKLECTNIRLAKVQQYEGNKHSDYHDLIEKLMLSEEENNRLKDILEKKTRYGDDEQSKRYHRLYCQKCEEVQSLRDMITRLEGQIRGMKRSEESYCREIHKLGRQLELYKQFFANNRVEVILGNGERKSVEEVI